VVIKRCSIINKDGKDIGMRDVSFDENSIFYVTKHPDDSITLILCQSISEEEYQLRNVGA